MKSTPSFFFLFCLGILSACQPTIQLPDNLTDEMPTFQVSAEIEGRATPFSFIVGGGRSRIDLLFNREIVQQGIETQLGNLSFIYPSRTNPFVFNNDYPLLQPKENTISYSIDIFNSSTLDYIVFIDDKPYNFSNFFTYPSAPKKITIKSSTDSTIKQTFYNPAFNPTPSANLGIAPGAGVVVGSLGASTFKWNTGSATPVSPLDSNATSKYYCVTVTGSNPEAHAEACGLVTKFNSNVFVMESQTHSLSVLPVLDKAQLNSDWMTLKFTDTDGVVYRSELGKQPAESFFAIERAESYTAPDFSFSGGFFSTNRSMLRLNIRFDCILYTPYGKKLHLKNGKGTIAVMVGF